LRRALDLARLGQCTMMHPISHERTARTRSSASSSLSVRHADLGSRSLLREQHWRYVRGNEVQSHEMRSSWTCSRSADRSGATAASLLRVGGQSVALDWQAPGCYTSIDLKVVTVPRHAFYAIGPTFPLARVDARSHSGDVSLSVHLSPSRAADPADRRGRR